MRKAMLSLALFSSLLLSLPVFAEPTVNSVDKALAVVTSEVVQVGLAYQIFMESDQAHKVGATRALERQKHALARAIELAQQAGAKAEEIAGAIKGSVGTIRARIYTAQDRASINHRYLPTEITDYVDKLVATAMKETDDLSGLLDAVEGLNQHRAPVVEAVKAGTLNQELPLWQAIDNGVANNSGLPTPLTKDLLALAGAAHERERQKFTEPTGVVSGHETFVAVRMNDFLQQLVMAAENQQSPPSAEKLITNTFALPETLTVGQALKNWHVLGDERPPETIRKIVGQKIEKVPVR